MLWLDSGKNPNTVTLTVKVSEQDMEVLKGIAKASSHTVSAVARNRIVCGIYPELADHYIRRDKPLNPKLVFLFKASLKEYINIHERNLKYAKHVLAKVESAEKKFLATAEKAITDINTA